MKISGKNTPVQTLVNKMNRGEISLKHKLQRREGVWNRQMKSLLIDSLLRGYLINPVYIVNDNGQRCVIDGVQRFSTLRDYVQDKFALSKILDPVIIEETTYEIAGKKISQLDEPVKDELLSASVSVYDLLEYTEKDVREMFRRINSGKPLNSTQKLTADMSDDLSDVVNTMVSHPFFERFLTVAQLKNSVDLAIALEILMLSEMSNEYDFGSFNRNDKVKFVQYYNDKINTEKVAIINQALDKLNESLEDDIKIPKLSVSLCVYGMYRTIKDKKSTEKYIGIIKDFLANYNTNEDYLQYCHQGTSNSEAVKGRLDYFRNMIRTL